MFSQFITAPVTDAGAVEEHAQRWFDTLAEHAPGWRGSVGGITPEGRLAGTILFDSPENADRNGRRPEQDRWWHQLLPMLATAPEVVDSTDVQLLGWGDVHDLGFIQIVRCRTSDPDRTHTLARAAMDAAMGYRPEILGALVSLDGEYLVETVGFRSEAEAREGERRAIPDKLSIIQEELMEILSDVEYYDLPTPYLFSPDDLTR